jgi:hypothetical protein
MFDARCELSRSCKGCTVYILELAIPPVRKPDGMIANKDVLLLFVLFLAMMKAANLGQ